MEAKSQIPSLEIYRSKVHSQDNSYLSLVLERSLEDFRKIQGSSLKGEERKEAEKNNEAARLWISGLEAVNRKLGLSGVIDLSATPFFLRGSGYNEGTLFPWTMNDFSLMDAIECGIVKLPRVPVAENIPGNEMPMFRDLWENIREEMPKKGRGKGGGTRPAQASDAVTDGTGSSLRALR